MVNPVKPPPGWLALPATATEEEKGYWNEFLEQWQLQERKFAQDEEEWSKISRRLRKEPAGKLYNHYIGKKVPPQDLTWGHLVAALILFGKDQVINSTFGRRIQEKYPRSDITTMQFNKRGPTIRIPAQNNGRGRSRQAESEHEEEDREETEEEEQQQPEQEEQEQQVQQVQQPEQEEPEQQVQQQGQQIQQQQQQEGDGNHRVLEEIQVSAPVSAPVPAPAPTPVPAPVPWNTRNRFTNTTPVQGQEASPHPRQGTTSPRDSARQAQGGESATSFPSRSSSKQPLADPQSDKPQASGPVQNRESPPQPDSNINVISNSDLDTTINVAQENSDSDLRQTHNRMTINSSPGPGDGCDGIYLAEDAVAAANTTTGNVFPSSNFHSIDLTSTELTASSVTDQSRNSRFSSNTSVNRFNGSVFPPSPWSTATSRPTPRKRNIDQVGDDITPRPSPASPAVWASLSNPSSPYVSTFGKPANSTYGHLTNHTGALEQILQRYHQLGGYVISLDGPENEHSRLRDNGTNIIRDIKTWGLEVIESRNRAMAELESLRESNNKFVNSNKDLELANAAKAEADKALDTLVSQFAEHLSDNRKKFDTFRQDVEKSIEENEAKTSRSLHEKLESLEAQMNTTTATLKEDRAKEMEMMQSKLERLEAMLEESTENNKQLEKHISGLTGVVADVGAATGVVHSEQQWNTALAQYGLR
ncbi:hypothetical protein FPOA_01706 [Fusarium poae]|uniref:Uncharacterized protein n=1 Tax=Fusarium poae TaxID=36050 RepID=A0A1B8B4V7_FUSPO|nr:hypothetical protein FPOA_01706 [Fusarium poae]